MEKTEHSDSRNLKFCGSSRSAQLPGQIRCKLAAARSSRSSRVRLAETLRGAPWSALVEMCLALVHLCSRYSNPLDLLVYLILCSISDLMRHQTKAKICVCTVPSSDLPVAFACSDLQASSTWQAAGFLALYCWPCVK